MPKVHGSEAGLSLTGETFRKLTHLFALVMPLIAYFLGSAVTLAVMIPLSVLAVVTDYFRVRSEALNRFISRFFGSTMRDFEKPPVGETMILNGATWTLLAFTILVLVFDLSLAVTMFSTCMIGDAAAAMIGRRIGRHNWGRSGCTLEGSLGYFVFGALTAVVIGGGGLFAWSPYSFPLTALIAGTAVGVVAEVARLPINDNLAAPLGSALSMALVLQFVYGIPLDYFPVF